MGAVCVLERGLESESLFGKDQRYIPFGAEVGMPDDVTNSELARSLARVEAKLDRSLDDHEIRLRRLEKYMWYMIGLSAAGAITGIGSLISAVSS